MPDRLAEFKRAVRSLPEHNRLWPLYGAGMEHLGDGAGHPVALPMPSYRPDELLVRRDA